MASFLEKELIKSWARRGALACALWPVALLFGVLTGVRRRLYRWGWLSSTRLPVPVIIVGNLFVGGTGKTPLTMWLIDALRHAGYRPGVIARGFGRNAAAVREVHANSLAADVGDEPLLIVGRMHVPMMVGRDRVAAAQALLHAHPQIDLIISDDGLQHYALQRTLEIVVSDGRGNGNGWLLPAGPLREAPQRRRDFSVVNANQLPHGADSATYLMRLYGEWAEQLIDPTVRLSFSDLQARAHGAAPSLHTAAPAVPAAPRILAAAGIGNPQRFFAMLAATGLHCEQMPLADHFDFNENPFADVRADIILITEKDAVKCRQHQALQHDPRIWVVPVAAQLDPTLAQHIVEKLRGHPIA